MAETVYLNDGSMEVVCYEKDVFLERLLREKLGDDAARFFTNYVNEIKEEAEYAEEAQREADRIADGYLTLCRQACDNFKSIADMLVKQKPDFSKALKTAQNAWRKIFNEI